MQTKCHRTGKLENISEIRVETEIAAMGSKFEANERGQNGRVPVLGKAAAVRARTAPVERCNFCAVHKLSCFLPEDILATAKKFEQPKGLGSPGNAQFLVEITPERNKYF